MPRLTNWKKGLAGKSRARHRRPTSTKCKEGDRDLEGVNTKNTNSQASTEETNMDMSQASTEETNMDMEQGKENPDTSPVKDSTMIGQKKGKEGKKTFKLSFDLEKFLDLKLEELNVPAQLTEEVFPITHQLNLATKKQKDISRLFEQCEETLQMLQESMDIPDVDEDRKSPVSRPVEEVIIDDSDDDDIVFVEATKRSPSNSRKKTPTILLRSPVKTAPQITIVKPTPPTYGTGTPSLPQVDNSVEGLSKMTQLRAALAARLNEQFTQNSGQQQRSHALNQPPKPVQIVQSKPPPPPPLTRAPTKTVVLPQSETYGTIINGTVFSSIYLAVGIKLLAKKFNDIWYKGTLTDVQFQERPRDQWNYKIKFDSKGAKVLPGRHLAYWETPESMIKVGSRVVAMYRDEETATTNSFYAGIVAEPLSVRNNHRLLVFFDDGYAQYCAPSEIHKVCEQSVEVWKDIHPDSHDFIREYLKQYPERPMVRLQKGQIVTTEWNGRWWTARVMEVDASLAKMFFDADNRTEWIYRGSTRLEPLYKALCKAAKANELSGKARRNNPSTMKGAKKHIVEYTRGSEEDKTEARTIAMPNTVPRSMSRQSSTTSTDGKKRSVAKKSTGGKSPSMDNDSKNNWEAPWLKLQRPSKAREGQNPGRFQTSSISNQISSQDMASVLQERLASVKHEDADPADIDDEAQGERTDIASLPARDAFRRKYVPHECSRQCNEILEDDPKGHKESNPLLIPMLCGWERQITKTKPLSRRLVMYKAPCGRRFRNIDEVDKYLFDTDCNLTIDLFCFDPVLHTDKEFVPVKTFCDIKDLSYGKETVPISCVNGIDRQYPDYVEYSNKRTPCKGVTINLDEDFLACCDCTDGCRDKSKCACCQQTIAASAIISGGKPNPGAGYQDRRLKESLLTGIYECNSRCKCDSRCHNRVAQHGLSLRLQVFKTENRGWGLRCLDDIPAGGFLCIYAGQLLTEQGANEDGQTYGDEYLAELDYIEVVERSKEGYESDIPESDKENNDEEEEDDDDEDHKAESSDSDFEFDGGKQSTADDDIQELRTLPARNRGARLTQLKDRKSTKLNPLVLRRDSAGQEKEWSIKVPESSSKSKPSDLSKQLTGKESGSEVMEIESKDTDQQMDSDELPDLDTGSPQPADDVPKESRVKNLPNPTRMYVRAHRSTGAASHDQRDRLNERAGNNETEEPPGTRQYFGGGQQCYIMDAKSMGNIGRYLNHSCSPNVFVTNVFVDTHDLRFPWVAFFAAKYIRQGTELTWDYNYEVGSVPGKILHCYCSSSECRGRLL